MLIMPKRTACDPQIILHLNEIEDGIIGTTRRGISRRISKLPDSSLNVLFDNELLMGMGKRQFLWSSTE
jgi:hypothetical protein